MSGLDQLSDAVQSAAADGKPMQIRGGNTRAFLGEQLDAESPVSIEVGGYNGIIDYHPQELVVRARAGTAVTDLVDAVAAEGQYLAFEPPVHGPGSTLGGTIACGLSGSRRPYAGAARDHVLGVGLIDGKGDYQAFGGQVMKNVAGYDVSRLVCGSHGMLGVIADVSLKVLPAPEAERTTVLELTLAAARDAVAALAGRVSPLSGAVWTAGQLSLRFSGSDSVVRGAIGNTGGDEVNAAEADNFWRDLDSQRLPVLESARELWRLSCSPLEGDGELDFAVQDWGFAQRWLVDPETDPRADYRGSGHWTCYRGQNSGVFEPLSDIHMALHQRLKSAFDPGRLFNPGRMYPGL